MGRNPLAIDQRPPGNSPSQLETNASIDFYLKDAPNGPMALRITDVEGSQVFTTELEGKEGINRYFWGMRFDPTEEQQRQQEERLAQLRAQFGGQAPGGSRGGGGVRGAAAEPGTYLVELTVDGRTFATTVTIREDPAVSGIQ
jgi:hypothetical protein